MRRVAAFGSLGAMVAMSSVVLLSAHAAPSPTAVPVNECGPNDRPETGLQGQVPWPDRLSGRAAEGYGCNLEIVGEFESASFANMDSYKDCVYYTDNAGGSGMAEGGAVVLDVSDPTNPVKTDYLTARAMGNGGESLRVNQERGLLVSDHYNSLQTSGDADLVRALAVYDVKKDCRHPELLADVIMPHAVGHEGCFQPDGRVYYMASTTTITPIDLTNPRRPTQLSAPWPLSIHGCSISDDGSRGYFASVPTGTHGLIDCTGMLVVDTSSVQKLRRNAGFKVVGCFPTPDAPIQQSTYPLRYNGRPYVFDWSEAAPRGLCTSRTSNFGYGWFIDMADEDNPREVSKVQTQVMLPENCSQVAADRATHSQGLDRGDVFWQAGAAGFSYDMHYCRPDRLHNPTIMGCASFGSGLRVFDIRDPRLPKEIAYYNTGTLSSADPKSLDWAVAPPVIRRDLGMIFWVTLYRGFHAAKFRAGVWPFDGDDRCPSGSDYFAQQYDMGYGSCRAANTAGKGAKATEPTQAHALEQEPPTRSDKVARVKSGSPPGENRNDVEVTDGTREPGSAQGLPVSGSQFPLGWLLSTALLLVLVGLRWRLRRSR
jgi:hypothetical protein